MVFLKRYYARSATSNPRIATIITIALAEVSQQICLCRALNCQPGELLEYEPDDSHGKVVSIVDVA